MKSIAIIVTLFFTEICLGQDIKIDSCGTDNSNFLNKYEINYFNQTLGKQLKRLNFNFNDTKIGFAYGNFGKGLISKKEYFDHCGRGYFKNNFNVIDQIIVLTDEERKESGGYDA
ncbi:MAG TPA: hypothetical protein VD884_00350 [Ohtaekwangia sp.]|nr:hypothetical protein [Ohtaekwangia sp.]